MTKGHKSDPSGSRSKTRHSNNQKSSGGCGCGNCGDSFKGYDYDKSPNKSGLKDFDKHRA